MKKLLTLICIIMMLASLAACGSSDEEVGNVSTTTQTETTETTTTEEATTTETTTELTTSEETQSEPEDVVDVESLKKIEKNDNFKVKVTKMEMAEDVFDDFLSDEVSDAVYFDITNNDDKPVSEVSIYVIAYNDKNEACKIKTSKYELAGFGSDEYLKGFVTGEDTVIKPGKTETVTLQLEKGSITGIRCIVGSYKKGGKEIQNDTVNTWYKNLYLGKTTVLE